jgi:hypothetical protein
MMQKINNSPSISIFKKINIAKMTKDIVELILSQRN